MPKIAMPPTGNSVLQYSFSQDSSDSASLSVGDFHMVCSYGLNLEFNGAKVIVTQNITVYMKIRAHSTSKNGNVVNKTLVDTYNLGVDENGRLVAGIPVTVLTDNPDSFDTDWFQNFWTGLNGLTGQIQSQVSGFTSGILKTFLSPQCKILSSLVEIHFHSRKHLFQPIKISLG
jgi:hypothetical protein